MTARLLAAVTLLAVAATQPRPSSAQADAGAPHLLPADPAYRVGADDVLEVEVLRDLSSSGRFVVGGDGTIHHPLLGPVIAGDRRCAEIADDIQRRLADGFVRSPRVTVRVAEYRSFRVSLVGAVRAPGIHFLRGPAGVLQLALAAGGTTGPVPPSAVIVRHDGGRVERVPVDLAAILRGARADVTLQRGDLVVVGESDDVTPGSGVTVVGEVKSPGVFSVAPGDTLLALILKAGGTTDFAKRNGTRVYRGDGAKPIEVRLADIVDSGDREQDIKVQAGDLVVVPSRFF